MGEEKVKDDFPTPGVRTWAGEEALSKAASPRGETFSCDHAEFKVPVWARNLPAGALERSLV